MGVVAAWRQHVPPCHSQLDWQHVMWSCCSSIHRNNDNEQWTRPKPGNVCHQPRPCCCPLKVLLPSADLTLQSKLRAGIKLLWPRPASAAAVSRCPSIRAAICLTGLRLTTSQRSALLPLQLPFLPIFGLKPGSCRPGHGFHQLKLRLTRAHCIGEGSSATALAAATRNTDQTLLQA